MALGGARLGAGRPKGSRNKTTTVLKEAVLEAAGEVGENGLGGDGLTGYLRKIAREEPKAFCSVLGRVLPLQVTGKDDGPIEAVTRITRVIISPPEMDGNGRAINASKVEAG